MPSKNNLSALKPKSPQKTILPSNDGAGDIDLSSRPLTGKGKVGRKPSPDKRTYKVTLSLTEGEGEKLQAKAGELVKDATYVYAHLVKTGFFD